MLSRYTSTDLKNVLTMKKQKQKQKKRIYYFLCINNMALRHVDTIKELTDILATRDLGDVVDHGSRLRDSIDIVASENDLILDLLRAVDGDTREHLDNTNELLTKEVVDADLGLVVADTTVDGEVSVDETHLVLVALGNTDDHVLQMTSNSTNAGNGLASSKPHLKDDVLVLVTLDGHVKVTDVAEVTNKNTTGALHSHKLGVDSHSDVLRDSNTLNKTENLHHCNRMFQSDDQNKKHTKKLDKKKSLGKITIKWLLRGR